MIDSNWLDWDTEFFGLSIAKVIVFDRDNLTKVLEEVEKYQDNGADLLYLFSDKALQVNYPLVDVKVLYALPLTKSDKFVSIGKQVQQYDEDKVSKELKQLAFDAGAYSRFKLDAGFPNGKFEELYTAWIEGSINRKLADVVFVARTETGLAGMVTAKMKENEAHIGLIAVNEKARGKGLGSLLVEAVKQYAIKRHAEILYVPTQQENKLACAFYEKNGFEIASKEWIYHVWSV